MIQPYTKKQRQTNNITSSKQLLKIVIYALEVGAPSQFCLKKVSRWIGGGESI